MSTLKVSDPMAGLCAFLKAQLADLLFKTQHGPAVFRPDLPKDFDQNMPVACIVVRPAGGYTRFGKSMLYMGDPRADLTCYGGTQWEATRVAQSAVVALKQLVSQTWENTRLYSANVSGGPTPLPDQQTLWPACWLAVQLVHGELPSPVGGG